MNLLLSVGLIFAGIALIVYFAEKLVEAAVGTARGFGLSAFVVSVVFIGFDPENLGVGAVGTYEGVAGIALGSIIGAALVAIALAFGITALFAPMEFAQAPGTVLVLPIVAVVLFGALCLDGELSRADGGILLASYAAAVGYLLHLSRRGVQIEPAEGREMREAERLGRWKAFFLLVLSLVAITGGGEMAVRGSKTVIERLGISETFFGMTILAFMVSIEELARELPAALEGRAEIAFGNVVGSIFAFFLLNAGIIALVRPIPVERQVLAFHLPAAVATTILVSGIVMTRRVPRWAGVLLVVLYVGFIVGSYFIGRGPGRFPAS